MTSYVTVRVVGADGPPKSGIRVSIGKDTFLGGISGSVYTNSEGEAEFSWEYGGPLVIYVNGGTALRNQPVKSYYKVTI